MWVKSIEILKSLGGAVETHLIKWQQKKAKKKIGIQRQKRLKKIQNSQKVCVVYKSYVTVKNKV